MYTYFELNIQFRFDRTNWSGIHRMFIFIKPKVLRIWNGAAKWLSTQSFSHMFINRTWTENSKQLKNHLLKVCRRLKKLEIGIFSTGANPWFNPSIQVFTPGLDIAFIRDIYTVKNPNV